MIWCLFYLIATYTNSQIFFQSDHGTLQVFLWGNLFRVEAYYLDAVFFFMSYLYVVKKPFHSVLFMARCKEFYLWHMILFGLKVSLFYIVYTAVLFLSIPFLKDVPMIYDGLLFFNFFNLFAHIFSMYLLYVFVLLLSGKQMLSLLTSLAINVNMSSIYWTIRYTDNPILLRGIQHVVLNYYAVIALLLLGIVVVVFRRRDFLL